MIYGDKYHSVAGKRDKTASERVVVLDAGCTGIIEDQWDPTTARKAHTHTGRQEEFQSMYGGFFY